MHAVRYSSPLKMVPELITKSASGALPGPPPGRGLDGATLATKGSQERQYLVCHYGTSVYMGPDCLQCRNWWRRILSRAEGEDTAAFRIKRRVRYIPSKTYGLYLTMGLHMVRCPAFQSLERASLAESDKQQR